MSPTPGRNIRHPQPCRVDGPIGRALVAIAMARDRPARDPTRSPGWLGRRHRVAIARLPAVRAIGRRQRARRIGDGSESTRPRRARFPRSCAITGRHHSAESSASRPSGSAASMLLVQSEEPGLRPRLPPLGEAKRSPQQKRGVARYGPPQHQRRSTPGACAARRCAHGVADGCSANRTRRSRQRRSNCSVCARVARCRGCSLPPWQLPPMANAYFQDATCRLSSD
jgi:hypothetical protein